MKLPSENLSVPDKLAEFDQWLTPKLERIKDTDKFNTEISSLCTCIRNLSKYLDNFEKMELCTIENLVDAIVMSSSSFTSGVSFFEDESALTNYYDSIFNLLFLATGATDNNLKNHFLIKLKEDEVSSSIPKRGSGKKLIKFTLKPLPNTTKADYVARQLAACYVGGMQEYDTLVTTEPTFSLRQYLKVYLVEYVSLILEDEEDILQLWAMCSSFMKLSSQSEDMARYLISSCTIFKVRGSVSASGGHIPENILREKLTEMGLKPDVDFNTSDVVIGEEVVTEGGKRKKKTRAYDFVLPYKTEGWQPKLFIQSQFYAGDSGSVSHKVVDQTSSSRQFTKEKYPDAKFIEYLDGAGYYASLRGDLEHMLTMSDTHTFIQVKSILIRLRREFQHIQYLTPVEFEHAIFETTLGVRDDVFANLIRDGYDLNEIERVEAEVLADSQITISNSQYNIEENRINYSRKLFLLDIAATKAEKITNEQRRSGRYILVPGFGSNYGILGSELAGLVCQKANYIEITPAQYEEDLEWLIDEKVIARC
ncbi:TPA: hypothetical protein KD877_003079 [Vibrio parahaemolyticus]|nr:hypothetical protein [Vibrio parahaemolyticus]